MTDRREDGWRVSRNIDLTHVISAVVLLVSVVVYTSRFDTRITVLEEVAKQQRATDQRQDDMLRQQNQDVQARLFEINQKLDRMIELRLNK